MLLSLMSSILFDMIFSMLFTMPPLASPRYLLPGLQTPVLRSALLSCKLACTHVSIAHMHVPSDLTLSPLLVQGSRRLLYIRKLRGSCEIRASSIRRVTCTTE